MNSAFIRSILAYCFVTSIYSIFCYFTLSLLLRGVVKKNNGYFTVRLTVRVDPLPPGRQLFANLFWWMQKEWCFLAQKHCFKPFLVVQNFHICLQSGPLSPYGQPDRKISVFWTTSLLFLCFFQL